MTTWSTVVDHRLDRETETNPWTLLLGLRGTARQGDLVQTDPPKGWSTCLDRFSVDRTVNGGHSATCPLDLSFVDSTVHLRSSVWPTSGSSETAPWRRRSPRDVSPNRFRTANPKRRWRRRRVGMGTRWTGAPVTHAVGGRMKRTAERSDATFGAPDLITEQERCWEQRAFGYERSKQLLSPKPFQNPPVSALLRRTPATTRCSLATDGKAQEAGDRNGSAGGSGHQTPRLRGGAGHGDHARPAEARGRSLRRCEWNVRSGPCRDLVLLVLLCVYIRKEITHDMFFESRNVFLKNLRPKH